MTRPLRELDREERLDRLRLIRTDTVGPVAFRELLARFGSAGAALQALPDLARRGGRRGTLRPPGREAVAREVARLEAGGGRLIALGEPDYPPLLATVDDAPPVLSVLGHPALAARPTVAIVGARNASLNGRKLAGTLARGLAAAGVAVASGLARGVDTAAHIGALEGVGSRPGLPAGGTIGVQAGGIDVVYPPENAELHGRIAAAGLILSECPLGTQPTARHFPRRNRIISGLARAVVVVEASARSGSLITARLAADQGREVLAVPGSPLDPRAQGPNGLIRAGATLVQTVDDVLEAIAGPLGVAMAEPAHDPFAGEAPPPVSEADVDAARERIAEALSADPTPVDEVVRGCQLSAAVVLAALLELELAGRIERHPGHRVSRTDY
jgi:DNA processing protein